MVNNILFLVCTLATVGVTVNGYKCPVPETVSNYTKFYLYGNSIPDRIELFIGRKDILDNINFNSSKAIKIITHGPWEYTNKTTQTSDIIDGFKKHEDVNIILVDWAPLAGKAWHIEEYPLVIECSRLVVAPFVGNFINFLYYEVDVPARNFHLIGFSAGAHVFGVATNVIEFKIPRISGLDPAGPLIDLIQPDSQKLSKDDADLVEIFHTNANSMGSNGPDGHYDFYCNGGISQPGCPNLTKVVEVGIQAEAKNLRDVIDTVIGLKLEQENSSAYSSGDWCSHRRAFQLYALNLDPAITALSYKCDNVEQAVANQCNGSPVAINYWQTYPEPGIYYVNADCIQ